MAQHDYMMYHLLQGGAGTGDCHPTATESHRVPAAGNVFNPVAAPFRGTERVYNALPCMLQVHVADVWLALESWNAVVLQTTRPAPTINSSQVM